MRIRPQNEYGLQRHGFKPNQHHVSLQQRHSRLTVGQQRVRVYRGVISSRVQSSLDTILTVLDQRNKYSTFIFILFYKWR